MQTFANLNIRSLKSRKHFVCCQTLLLQIVDIVKTHEAAPRRKEWPLKLSALQFSAATKYERKEETNLRFVRGMRPLGPNGLAWGDK